MKKTILFLFFLTLLLSCNSLKEPNKKEFTNPEVLNFYYGNEHKPSLKAHLKNGDLYVFEHQWVYLDSSETIIGYGTHYNPNRDKLGEGTYTLLIDSIALLEGTEKLKDHFYDRVASLMLFTGVNMAFTAICITNPKVCFGSCPTFYTSANQHTNYSAAEGFSAAILPSMEYGDLDDLQTVAPKGSFTLFMKNEAAERHAINQVYVEAVKLLDGENAYHSPADNQFYVSRSLVVPKTCSSDSLLAKLSHPDKIEYRSKTAHHSLTEKETLEIEFDSVESGNHGLVVDFRQSFVSTYLFYKVFDLMGDEAPSLAKMEYDTLFRQKFYNILNHLGTIKIEVYDTALAAYTLVGSLNENGPIAINKQLVILPHLKQKKVKLRLTYTKGLWCFDALNLALHVNPRESKKILVHKVVQDHPSTQKAEELLHSDDNSYFIADAGEGSTLHFTLPYNKQQVFLYSKGFYTEYIRSDWMERKNLLNLARTSSLEPLMWRQLAKEFKSLEPIYESDFFASKFNPQIKL